MHKQTFEGKKLIGVHYKHALIQSSETGSYFAGVVNNRVTYSEDYRKALEYNSRGQASNVLETLQEKTGLNHIVTNTPIYR